MSKNIWKRHFLFFLDIFKEGSEEIKRDSLFYLALAEAKQKVRMKHLVTVQRTGKPQYETSLNSTLS